MIIRRLRLPRFRVREEARTNIFESIEVFYNRERLQSTINYMTPIAFLKAWRAEQQKSATSPVETALQL